MPTTALTDVPRAPRTVQVDDALSRELLVAALRVSFAPRRIGRALLAWATVGVLLGLVTHSATWGWIVGAGVPAVLAARVALTTVARFRAVARPGSSITSGYDASGRLVLVRETGDLVLPAGSAAVTLRGRVAVIAGDTRRSLLLTARELLTDVDVEYLTTPPVPLPWSVAVPPATRRRLMRAGLRARLGTPAGLLLLCWLVLALGLVFLAFPPAEATAISLVVLVLGPALGVLGARRVLYRPGTVRAGLTDEGLCVAGLLPRPVTFRPRTHLTRTPYALLLRRRGLVHALPPDLVPDEHLPDVRRALDPPDPPRAG